MPTQAQVEAESEGIEVPVVMYHSVLNNTKGQYVVSEKQLEDDIISLQKEGFTSILPTNLVQYCYNEGSLPQKPIIITFDDGLYNNLYYAVPILEKYQIKAVFSVIGTFTEHATVSNDKNNPNYSHLTWEQVALIVDNPLFEIGNHTYNMHNYSPRFGVGKRKCETLTEYRTALKNDITKMDELIAEKCNGKCYVFAYPFGKFTPECDEILDRLNYSVRFTCSEQINLVKKGQPKSLLKLGRFNRDGRYNSEKVIGLLEGKIKST